MTQSVMLAIPAYTGSINLLTNRSLMVDALALASAGVSLSLNDEVGNTLIEDMRAQMLHDFLESDATDLVFIDNDVAWPAGALPRLLSHPVDLVGGIYPQRKDPITFSVRTKEKDVYPVDAETGLVEVEGLHGGFLRITRACAEKMVDAYPDCLIELKGKVIPDLFARFKVPGTHRKLGEDYAFCQRWIDIGGTVYLDAGFNMAHIGLKAYIGQFGKFVPKGKDMAA
ncbi:MAG TPA: hypothetical protein P5114_09045 [Hyphomicrobiaceae bacterium]|nr:hypothetical protein [Hyphomicrobiaceae bacterium]